MLALILVHIPWNTISNLELQLSYKALRNDQLVPSVTTHSNMSQSEYALTMDAVKKQLPSPNAVILILVG
jgi:hypothetical protein